MNIQKKETSVTVYVNESWSEDPFVGTYTVIRSLARFVVFT